MQHNGMQWNGMDDHVHVAIMIPPMISVSDLLGKIKGSSSYFLNKELQITQGFRWQDGFGVDTFSKEDLNRILDYIRRQKTHHAERTTNVSWEETSDDLDLTPTTKLEEPTRRTEFDRGEEGWHHRCQAA
jgi:hypothetical protein